MSADVLPNERKEHDEFIQFAKQHCRISFNAATVARTCSASRHIRLMDAPRKVLVTKGREDQAVRKAEVSGDEAAAAAADAARTVTEEQASAAASAFDFRGGRGLLATEDVSPGRAVLRAPVASCALNVPFLMEQHAQNAARYATDDAAAAAFNAMPRAEDVHAIVTDMMIRDPFYHHQLHLTTWLAWERFDPTSPVAPYLDSMPVPAVDDNVVLTVHAGGLSSLQANEYLEYHQDFLFAIKRIRASWHQRVERLSVDADLKRRALARIPPIQVFDWAWRTVLGRQVPIPTGGVAPGMACYRGSQARSVHYAAWMELTHQHHLLAPSLTPVFDLVDHSSVPNCELDVIMRPLKPDGTVDDDACDEYTRLLVRNERLTARGVKNPLAERKSHHRRNGLADKLRVLNTLKRLADKAQQAIVGETGGTAAADEREEVDLSDSDALRLEKARRREELTLELEKMEQALGARVAPVIELRATADIKAGDAFGLHFALLHSRPFTLYRFGFEPV